MEKQGFIYIWYDRKKKMYYIGCHWGHEWDRYICSSKRMKYAYGVRHEDFKRRIIQRNIPKDKLLEEEHKWLSLIPDKELGKQYYNHSNKHFGHWSNHPDRDEVIKRCAPKTIKTYTPKELAERGKRISEAKQISREKKMALGVPIRQPEKDPRPPRGPQSQEEKDKRSESLKQAWIEGRNVGTTGRTYEWSDQRKSNHLNGVQNCHVNRDPQAYVEGNKRAWADGKYANRKSNNMKDYIWVKFADGRRSRIKPELFNPEIHTRGKL